MTKQEIEAAMAQRPEGSQFAWLGGTLIAAHPEHAPAYFHVVDGWISAGGPDTITYVPYTFKDRWF